MFFNHKSSSSLPRIQLFYNNTCIYQGLLKDIPLKDSIIIEKSILFFNDPEPCNIHRTAVRLRITEELSIKLKETEQSECCQLLLALCPFENIDRVILPDQLTNK
jgi:hypothetical protein